MMILYMDLEMPGKMLDALAQQRNLHLWRAGVRRMNPELLDHLLFLRFSNSHISAFSLSFLFSCKFSTTLVQSCKAGKLATEAQSVISAKDM
jgi:hypothetical protein